MASVHKRGEHWRVMWKDRHGSAKQKSFELKRDAVAFKSQVEVDLRTGVYVDPQLSRGTFGSHHAVWLSNRRVSKSRAAMEESIAGKHILPRWKDVRLEDITIDDAQAWVNDLLDHGRRAAWSLEDDGTGPALTALGLSPSTVRSCARMVSQVLDSAVRSRRLAMNPMPYVQVKGEAHRLLTEEDVLTAEELERLVSQVEPRWRAFVYATGWLGWRLGEGLGLRRCDINELRGTVTVGRAVVEEVRGVSVLRVAKPGTSDGKSKAAGRVIPVPPTVMESLKHHMAHFVTDDHPEACLFVQGNGCHPARTNLLRRVLRPALIRSDLDGRHITFRQLRHTAASLMDEAGVDDHDISYRLGHARPSITKDIYTHLFKRTETQGTDAMELRIRKARQA